MLLVNCLPLTSVIVINEKFNAKQCSLIRNRHHELAMDNKHINKEAGRLYAELLSLADDI